MEPIIDTGDPSVIARIFGIPLEDLYELYPSTLHWDTPTLNEYYIHKINSPKIISGSNQGDSHHGATMRGQSGRTLRPIGFSVDNKRYYIKTGTTVQIVSDHERSKVFFPVSSIEPVVQGGRHRKRRNKSIRRKKSTRKSRRAH